MKTFIFTSPALIFDSHEGTEPKRHHAVFLLASLLNPCDFRSLVHLHFLIFFAPNWVKVSPGAICAQYGQDIGNNRSYPFDMAALMCSYSQFGENTGIKRQIRTSSSSAVPSLRGCSYFQVNSKEVLAISFYGLSWISWAGARLKQRRDCRLRQSSSSGYFIRKRSGHRWSVNGTKNSRTRVRLMVKTHEGETCWSSHTTAKEIRKRRRGRPRLNTLGEGGQRATGAAPEGGAGNHTRWETRQEVNLKKDQRWVTQ